MEKNVKFSLGTHIDVSVENNSACVGGGGTFVGIITAGSVFGFRFRQHFDCFVGKSELFPDPAGTASSFSSDVFASNAEAS